LPNGGRKEGVHLIGNEGRGEMKQQKSVLPRLSSGELAYYSGAAGSIKKPDYWIPVSVRKHKKGSLHRMLGVPKGKKIPFTMLEKIRQTPIGETIKNPVELGKDRIKVTRKLKARSVWGLNLKRISQGKGS
jgi:hypothetical protein